MKPLDVLAGGPAASSRIVDTYRARIAQVIASVTSGQDIENLDMGISIIPRPITSLFDSGAIRGALTELLDNSVGALTPDAIQRKFRVKVLAEV